MNKTQQMIESQLEQIKIPTDEEEVTYEEVFGQIEDWTLRLGDQRLFLDPTSREWFYFDHLHHQWVKTGVGPGQIEFVEVFGKLGVKRINKKDDSEQPTMREQHQHLLMFLEVVSGPVRGEKFQLKNGLIVGRSNGVDVQIMSAEASRQHAKITLDVDERWLLADLDSTNGTVHNGVEISGQVVLKVGDEIKIGDVVFNVTGGK